MSSGTGLSYGYETLWDPGTDVNALLAGWVSGARVCRRFQRDPSEVPITEPVQVNSIYRAKELMRTDQLGAVAAGTGPLATRQDMLPPKP